MQRADGRHHAALRRLAHFLQRHCFWLLVACYALATIWPAPGRTMRDWRWTLPARSDRRIHVAAGVVGAACCSARRCRPTSRRFARSASGPGRSCVGTLAVWVAPALLVIVAAIVVPWAIDGPVDGRIAGRPGTGGVDAGRQFVGRLDAIGPRQSGAQSGAGAGHDFSLSVGDAVAAWVWLRLTLSPPDQTYFQALIDNFSGAFFIIWVILPTAAGLACRHLARRAARGRGKRLDCHRQRRVAALVELRECRAGVAGSLRAVAVRPCWRPPPILAAALSAVGLAAGWLLARLMRLDAGNPAAR